MHYSKWGGRRMVMVIFFMSCYEAWTSDWQRKVNKISLKGKRKKKELSSFLKLSFVSLITRRSSNEAGHMNFMNIFQNAPSGWTSTSRSLSTSKNREMPSQGTESSTPLGTAASWRGMLPGEITSLRGHRESVLGLGIEAWNLFHRSLYKAMWSGLSQRVF